MAVNGESRTGTMAFYNDIPALGFVKQTINWGRRITIVIVIPMGQTVAFLCYYIP